MMKYLTRSAVALFMAFGLMSCGDGSSGAQGYYMCVPLPAEKLIRWLDGMDWKANMDADRPIFRS